MWPALMLSCSRLIGAFLPYVTPEGLQIIRSRALVRQRSKEVLTSTYIGRTLRRAEKNRLHALVCPLRGRLTRKIPTGRKRCLYINVFGLAKRERADEVKNLMLKYEGRQTLSQIAKELSPQERQAFSHLRKQLGRARGTCLEMK